MNIQEEVSKIHAQYGTSELANYKIQLMVDKIIVGHNENWAKSREQTAVAREQTAIRFMLTYYVDEEHSDESEESAIDHYNKWRNKK